VTAGNPYYAMQDALAVPTTTSVRKVGQLREPGACSSPPIGCMPPSRRRS
jgi:hypothetical protein